MKNIEKYLDELSEHGIDFAITKDDKVINCKDSCCNECIFHSDKKNCEYQLLLWLFKEEKEPKKIDLPKDIKVDAQILVSNSGRVWFERHFAKRVKDVVYTFYNGATSWSHDVEDGFCDWQYAKMPKGESGMK